MGLVLYKNTELISFLTLLLGYEIWNSLHHLSSVIYSLSFLICKTELMNVNEPIAELSAGLAEARLLSQLPAPDSFYYCAWGSPLFSVILEAAIAPLGVRYGWSWLEAPAI